MKNISFEFFPPKTEEGRAKLRNTRDELAKLNPQYFSVTFGAGGSTQSGTYETVVEIQQETGIGAAPHLSCIGSTKENIREILNAYREKGIYRIVALRGDMPSGMQEAGEFRHANELVAFIRKETGDYFHIEVAAYPEFHPQSSSPKSDLENFKKKVDAGANSAITQYFYNSDAYFRFVDDADKMGIQIPIVPGIMPITNCNQLIRFSDACGAEIPIWIRKRLEGYGDDLDSIRKFGFEVTVQMCNQLLEQEVPGLHFYSMNQVQPSKSICMSLSISC